MQASVHKVGHVNQGRRAWEERVTHARRSEGKSAWEMSRSISWVTFYPVNGNVTDQNRDRRATGTKETHTHRTAGQEWEQAAGECS